MRVKCLAQGHNTMSPAGLEPTPLGPETSALTMRPPRLHSLLSTEEILLSFSCDTFMDLAFGLLTLLQNKQNSWLLTKQ